MEQESTTVTISFKPVLHQICVSLGFPPLIYNSSPTAVHDCYVLVCYSNTPRSFIYFGGDEGTFEETVERAAKQMVLFLVKEYDRRVDDVNLGIWEESEDAVSEFKLKRNLLECVEKGIPSLPLDAHEGSSLIARVSPSVSIDFYALLAVMISKFQVPVTHVEHLQYAANDNKVWLSVVRPGSIPQAKWIRSERCSSMAATRQSLTKKALLYLMPIYNFNVEDVNYHFVQFSTVTSKLERESYMTIKEHVHELKEDSTACPIFQQELDLTPRGVEFRIPATLSLPKPPKKHGFVSTSRCFSDVVPNYAIPSELREVVPRRKTN